MLVLAVSLAAPAIAQTPPGATPAPARPAAPVAQPIPRATFIANVDTDFARMDANKDGKLTKLEIETFQKGMVLQQAQARRRALFAALDADHNGQISADEFLKLPMPIAPVNAGPMLQRLDTNRDNLISLDEYRAGTLAKFDKLDVNKDGIVSAAEMRDGGIIK